MYEVTLSPFLIFWEARKALENSVTFADGRLLASSAFERNSIQNTGTWPPTHSNMCSVLLLAKVIWNSYVELSLYGSENSSFTANLSWVRDFSLGVWGQVSVFIVFLCSGFYIWDVAKSLFLGTVGWNSWFFTPWQHQDKCVNKADSIYSYLLYTWVKKYSSGKVV